MNQDDIIRMAREAGAMFDHMTWVERDLAPVFERFAALVIANNPPQSSMSWQEGFEAGKQAEREECAKVADEWVKAYPHPSETIAAAIRARGQK